MSVPTGDLFSCAFGEGRGSGRADPPAALIVGPPAPGEPGGATQFCSGCGNEPYLTPDGWRGHDEDCDRLGEPADTTCTDCSLCGERLSFSPAGSWVGHRAGCSQQGMAPDA